MTGPGFNEHEKEKEIATMDLFSAMYNLIDLGAGE